jgi:hypothetical protein
MSKTLKLRNLLGGSGFDPGNRDVVKMLDRIAIGAVLVSVIFAQPAAAQVEGGRTGSETTLGPSYLPPPDVRQFRFDLPPDRARRNDPRISVSATPYRMSDGSQTLRKGLVGSLPIAPNVDLGLGLFEVNRTSPEEKALIKSNPIKDVRPETDRTAALGLSFRF